MKFENYISEKLKNKETDIDATKMWDGVSDRIAPKRKRRVLPILLVAGLLLISSILFYSLKNNTQSDDKNGVVVTNDNIINEDKKVEIQIERKVKEASEAAQSVNTENNSLSQTATYSSNSSNDFTVDPNNPANTEVPNTISKPILTNTKTKITNKIINGFKVPSQESSRSKALSEAQIERTILANIRYIANLDCAELNTSRSLPILRPSPLKNKQFSQDQHFPKWSLIYTASIGKTQRTLSGENSTILDLKKQYETPLEYLHTSFLLRRKITSSLSFGSGISWNQLVEKMEWDGTYEQHQSEKFVSHIHINTAQDSIKTFTSGYTGIVDRSILKYNTFRQWSIPIELRYSRHQWKTDWSIKTGLDFRISQQNTGTILNEKAIPVRISDSTTRTGLGYFIGLDLEKAVANKIAIQAGLTYRKLPNVQNTHSNVVATSRYRVLLLDLGIIYKM